MKANVQMLPYGDKERITLPKPIWEGKVIYRTGITLRAIYAQPVKQRVIIETYSIWEDRETHCCVGTEYRELDVEQIQELCKDFEEVDEIVSKRNN